MGCHLSEGMIMTSFFKAALSMWKSTSTMFWGPYATMYWFYLSLLVILLFDKEKLRTSGRALPVL